MSDRLDGWKAIATHVRRSVRTAQRWERELALPVHRVQMDGGEIVYARAAEIDAWMRMRERPPAVAAAPLPDGDAAAIPEPAPAGAAVPLDAPCPDFATLWAAGLGLLALGVLLGYLAARLT